MASGCEIFLMKNSSIYPLESCATTFLFYVINCRQEHQSFITARGKVKEDFHFTSKMNNEYISSVIRTSYMLYCNLVTCYVNWFDHCWFLFHRMSRLKMRAQLLPSMDHLLRFRKSSWWKRKKMKKLPAKQNSKKPSSKPNELLKGLLQN